MLTGLTEAKLSYGRVYGLVLHGRSCCGGGVVEFRFGAVQSKNSDKSGCAASRAVSDGTFPVAGSGGKKRSSMRCRIAVKSAGVCETDRVDPRVQESGSCRPEEASKQVEHDRRARRPRQTPRRRWSLSRRGYPSASLLALPPSSCRPPILTLSSR